MEKLIFRTSLTVNEETGRIMAVYFSIRDGKVANTKEVVEGSAFADYDSNGLLLGVELIAPCEVTIWDKITKKETRPVRKFLRGATPQDLILKIPRPVRRATQKNSRHRAGKKNLSAT